MYVIVWSFTVKERFRTEFERAYGLDGDWVRLFRQGKGYVSTDLFEDTQHSGTFLTVDRWKSEQEYRKFREQHDLEYRNLDRQFEALCDREEFIGAFTTSSR